MQLKTFIGKILYGSLFIVAIPALLIVWAHYTSQEILLPVPANKALIYLTLSVGIFFVVFGMLHLWIFGKGLPMNAFPPKYFVKKGVFAITKNPIYLGTIITCFGVSALVQSSSGFWLVSPMFALMIIAYTVGFENERTKKVFGKQDYRPFLSLPEKSDRNLTPLDRASAYLLVFLPWLLIYDAFIFLGTPGNAVVTNFAFEDELPVIEISSIFYVSTYLFALLVPLVITTKRVLREFETDAWLATGFSAIAYFTLPFIVTQRSFVPKTLWGEMLMLDRSLDGVNAAFPAFHVVWAFIAARYFSLSTKRLSWLWYTLATFASLSCITTGNHSIADVAAGFVVFIVVYFRKRIWDFVRRWSERLANSWREWKVGPVRIINHGFYAGASGFVGTLLVGSFLGSRYAIAGFITGIFGIIGAALWAQFIEGSPRLQRPYGYYGSVAGVFIGSILIINIFPVEFLVLLAAFALAAPWIQVLGRLRCLVQGCCHGKATSEWLGLHFTHPLSRVNKISGLKGTPLHPTQLYSIGTNLLTGLILFRLFSLNMSATFIVGMYLLCNGLGRFVEEYFRGEAQTPYWAGMRIYQWIAIINIILGAIFTSIPSGEMPGFQWNLPSFYWAVAMGLFATMAYGVDFPRSNRRFARLTSA